MYYSETHSKASKLTLTLGRNTPSSQVIIDEVANVQGLTDMSLKPLNSPNITEKKQNCL